MKEKKKKEAVQKNYLPHRILRYVAWTGSVASNGVSSILVGYLSYYLTDSVFMAAGSVAAILAASRVFDGISDIIAGFIIDHTKTKLGKARPYSLFALVMWVGVILLFSVPDLSTTGKFIYVFLTYNLVETIGRTMDTCAGAVHYKLGFTEDEQVQLTGVCGLFGGIVSLVAGVALPILVENYGTSTEGWRMIAIAIALPCMVLSVLKLFFIPEVDEVSVYESRKKRASVKESVKMLFSDKYLLMFLLAFLLTNFAQSTGIATYYFEYIVGDISAQSIVSVFGLFAMVVMPLLPTLARKVGIAKTIVISLMTGFVGMLLPYISPDNLVLISIGQAIYTVSVIPVSMYSSLILIQCMKYTEWKDHKQIDGVVGSMSGFASKVGRALGALLTGLLLDIAGYNGSLEVQSSSANSMITFIYLGIPAITCLIAAIAMMKYDLEKKMPQIEADLAARNQAQKAEKVNE